MYRSQILLQTLGILTVQFKQKIASSERVRIDMTILEWLDLKNSK